MGGKVLKTNEPFWHSDRTVYLTEGLSTFLIDFFRFSAEMRLIKKERKRKKKLLCG